MAFRRRRIEQMDLIAEADRASPACCRAQDGRQIGSAVARAQRLAGANSRSELARAAGLCAQDREVCQNAVTRTCSSMLSLFAVVSYVVSGIW